MFKLGLDDDDDDNDDDAEDVNYDVDYDDTEDDDDGDDVNTLRPFIIQMECDISVSRLASLKTFANFSVASE